jgi:hypothetical protein
MRRLTIAVAALVAIAVHGLSAAPSLDTLLARVAGQVLDFKTRFSFVVGREDYGQFLRETNGRSRSRQLRSDVFFFSPAPDGPAMTVRTVQSVDGRELDRPAHLVDEALALPADRRLEKLRALANAGASYNLGTLRRNFNEPTLALTFGAPDYQKRFKFRVEPVETIDGEQLYPLSFAETERPTVIRDGRNGADIPASGRLWISEQGVVKRTELRLDKSDTFAVIRVSYRRDERLGIMVPAAMDEDYRYRDKDNARLTFISAHASYSNYRRFETSVRIVAP